MDGRFFLVFFKKAAHGNNKRRLRQLACHNRQVVHVLHEVSEINISSRHDNGQNHARESNLNKA